jgi:hypothetical protein
MNMILNTKISQLDSKHFENVNQNSELCDERRRDVYELAFQIVDILDQFGDDDDGFGDLYQEALASIHAGRANGFAVGE